MSYRFVATGTWYRVLNTPVVWDNNAVLSEWYFSVRILALEECLAHFPLHVPLHFFSRPCLHEPRTDTARSVVHQQLMVRKWGWVGVSLLVWPSCLRLSFDWRSQCLYPTRCFDLCLRFWCARLFLWKQRGLWWDDPVLRGVLHVVCNRPRYRTSSRIVTYQMMMMVMIWPFQLSDVRDDFLSEWPSR